MITCSICETATVDSPDEAIEKNWIPTWYVAAMEQPPCCNACAQFLRAAPDGELELIPGII